MINFSEVKKFCVFSFIGSLIVAALVAVFTVLFGHFNEITARVFFTLFMVVLHSLVSLAFVWDDSRKNTFEKLSFFVNTVFVIIVMSFIASVFGIWKIVSAENIWHVYQTFFLLGFASLHADIVSKASGKEKYMNMVIYANYAFIAIVFLMLLPTIFVKNAFMVLPELYYRFLAAVAIIDGTLSVLTIIFYKLYMHKHPELRDVNPRKGLSIWMLILIIFFGIPLFIYFMLVLIGMIVGASQFRSQALINQQRSQENRQTQNYQAINRVVDEKTYINNSYGFSFDYPVTTTVETSNFQYWRPFNNEPVAYFKLIENENQTEGYMAVNVSGLAKDIVSCNAGKPIESLVNGTKFSSYFNGNGDVNGFKWDFKTIKNGLCYDIQISTSPSACVNSGCENRLWSSQTQTAMLSRLNVYFKTFKFTK